MEEGVGGSRFILVVEVVVTFKIHRIEGYNSWKGWRNLYITLDRGSDHQIVDGGGGWG